MKFQVHSSCPQSGGVLALWQLICFAKDDVMDWVVWCVSLGCSVSWVCTQSVDGSLVGGEVR